MDVQFLVSFIVKPTIDLLIISASFVENNLTIFIASISELFILFYWSKSLSFLPIQYCSFLIALKGIIVSLQIK